MAAQRPSERFCIGHLSQRARAGARNQGAWELPHRSSDPGETGALRRVAENPTEYCAAPCKKEMRQQPPRLVNVFPDEQNEIFLENRLNVRFRETAADGSTMLVIHHARRLVQNFPSAFPGEISEVRVFQVKRRQQRVEPTQLEKLPPVKCARSSATVEARVWLLKGGFDPVTDAQRALLPPALGKPGFFTLLGRI